MNTTRRVRGGERLPPPKEMRGFTLVELLSVLAILAILIGLLIPLLVTARRDARRVTCLSNLHQLGIAVGMYVHDADSLYPWAINPADAAHPERWEESPSFESAIRRREVPQFHKALIAYVPGGALFRCPSDDGLRLSDPYPGWLLSAADSSFQSFGTSYFYRSVLAAQQVTESRLESTTTVVLFDAGGWWHGAREPDASARSLRYNTLFADLHAKNISQTDLAKNRPLP